MANVGSIELELKLNRSGFDRDLAELQSLKLEPLKLEIQLDGKNLRSQVKSIKSADIGCISIELCPDIKGFERKLKALPKSLVDCIEVELCPDLDGFERKVKQGLAGKKFSTDIGLDTRDFQKNIQSAFEGALGKVDGKGIGSIIGGILTAPLKVATGALAPLFLGLSASITLPLGQQIGIGLTKGLQSKFGSVIGSFELLGDRAGQVIGGGIESGFTAGLDAAKKNANSIVKVLEQTLGKDRLKVLFGNDYRTKIGGVIQGLAPGQSLSSALGSEDVLVESASGRAAASNTRLERRNLALKQLETEQKAAAATLSQVKQSAAQLDAATASFLAEYRKGTNNLTKAELARFQSAAKLIDEQRDNLVKQVAQLQAIANNAQSGLKSLGATKPKNAPQSRQLPQTYIDIAQETARRSGIELAPNQIPKVAVDKNLSGLSSATYNAAQNKIALSAEAAQLLRKGVIDSELVETIVHELRHAAQSKFGKVKLDPNLELIKPDPSEIKKIGNRIEQSVEFYPQQNRALGRQVESDAYTFAERQAGAIAESLRKKQAATNFERNLGVGGARAELEFIRSSVEQKGKVERLGTLAASYGIDLSKEIQESLQNINSAESQLEAVLAKARSLELLPADDIVGLQKEILSELRTALEEVDRQGAALKSTLINKKKEQSSGRTELKIPLALSNPELVPALAVERQQTQAVRAKPAFIPNNFNAVESYLTQARSSVSAGSVQGAKESADKIQSAFRTTSKKIKDLQAAGATEEAKAYAELFIKNAKRAQQELTEILQQTKTQGLDKAGGAEISGYIGRSKSSITNMLKPVSKIAGANVGEGLTVGIDGQLGNAQKAGEKLGEATIKGAKKKLDIQSPSRVFYQLGKFTAEGFKNGVEDAEPILEGLNKEIQEGINKAKNYLSNLPPSGEIGKFTTDIFNTKSVPTESMLLGSDGRPIDAKQPPLQILARGGTPLNSKPKSVNILGSNGKALNSNNASVDILGADGKPFTPIDPITKDLNVLKRQELYRKAELEEDLARLKESANRERKIKRKTKNTESSNDTKELEKLLKSVDEALVGVDKEIASQIKNALQSANSSLKSVKNLNSLASKNVRRATKKTDEALKQLENKTDTEVAVIESEAEAKRQGELRQLENRLQRRYDIQPSLPVSPLPSMPGDSKSEIKSIGGAIKSVFKGLQTSRFDAAKKQADALAQQANILLIDINSTIAIGKAAEAEAKALQRAIATNERKVEAILNQIKKANSGRSAKLTPGDLLRLSAQASGLTKQIDADREALAPANLRASKGKELQPFAGRLTSAVSGVGTETNLTRVQDFIKELKQTFRSLGENPSTSFLSSLDEGITGLIPKLGGLVKGFLAFQGALILQNALSNFARGAIDAAVKVDKLQTALKFASGSEIAGTRNLEFIRSEVERLKIPLGASTEGFTKLAAATRGTTLAGRTTRDIFTGVSEASTVLSLSAEQTSGIFTALGQSISGGTVQLEELRQLTESGGLVGGFSLAARALGVTEAQLRKLLETGRIAVADFFPRFAKQLKLEFGGASVEASGNAQNAIFGLQNTILSLQASAGKSILPAFTSGLNVLSGILKTVAGSIGEIILAITALTIALSVKLGLALKETIANLILTRATGSTLGGAFNDVARYINNSATVKISVGIFSVIEAVKLLYDTVNTDLVNSFGNAAAAAERAAVASRKALLPQSPKNNTDELPAVSLVDSFARNSVKQPFLLKPFFGLPEALGRGANFLKTGKFDYVNYGELQRDNLISSLGDFNFGNNQLISNATNSLSRLKGIGGLGGVDEELRNAQSQRAVLQGEIERNFSRKGLLIPPEYEKQVENLTAKIDKLSESRVNLAKPLTEDLVRVTNQIAATKSQIQSLEDPKTIAALGGEAEASRQKQQLQITLDALKQFKFNAEEALASLKVDPVLAFSQAIAKLNIELAKNQEATQKTFLTQKSEISKNTVSNFGRNIALNDTASLQNAIAERDRIKNDLASIEKDFQQRQSALNAPEFSKTLQKFGLTNGSSAAEIQGRIDTAENADKPVLEQIKATREAEAKVLETRQQAADAEQKLQQARQQSALNSLQRYGDNALALSKRTENQQVESLKRILHEREISEEEGAVRTSAIQEQSLARQKDVVETQLNLLRSYYAQGVVGAEEFNKRERDLLNSQSDFKRQLAEAEIATREAQYKEALDQADQANKNAEALIAQYSTVRQTQAKQLQLQLINTLGDQKGNELQVQGINIDAEKQATIERIDLIKVELEQVRVSENLKYITAKEAVTKRRQLLQQLADANLKRLDGELQQEKNYRDGVNQLIDSQVQKQKNSADLAINGIERQKDAQNLLTSSIERTQKLQQSRFDLDKAFSDAAVAEGQTRIDRINSQLEAPGANKPELLQQRANIENEISSKRLDALKAEQQFQQQNLKLEIQKQNIVARTAFFEAEIARLKAQQGIIEANAALNKANISRDTAAIDAAKLGLEIANRQLELSDRQLENAKENLKIQGKLASNATEAQSVQQKSALDSAIGSDALRREKPITSNLAESIPSSPAGAIAPAATNRKQLTLLEQARLTLPSVKGMNTNVIDQSRSQGLNPRTSVEALFNRQVGITPTDLVDAAKPVDVKPQTNGFIEFTKGLSEANKGIEQKLQALIDVTLQAAGAPRQLYVSSPSPITDAAQIYSDISRGIVLNAGLA